jgi:beta-lactamase class A
MASTAKIAVAMLAAARIASGELSLDEQIPIDPQLLAPGLARSPLDHLFYSPFERRRSETVHRLLGFMIHKSDNTATDVLLHRLGGLQALTRFVESLGISGFRFKRTFGQLVAFYFDLRLPPDRRPRLMEIISAIRRLRSPYVCRNIPEETLIASGEDCCTPNAMADLLVTLAMRTEYSPAYSYMLECEGGLNRIRRGLASSASRIKAFSHKTGSIGGVANDAGIVRFRDGSFAVICIMTSRASAPMRIRDEQIAAATRAIMARVQ